MVSCGSGARPGRRAAFHAVRLTIRVKPGVSRAQVGGEYDGALVVSVRQRAVDGQATEAALRAVAEAVGVRRRHVTLITGVASRTKLLELAIEPDAVATVQARIARLRAWPDEPPS